MSQEFFSHDFSWKYIQVDECASTNALLKNFLESGQEHWGSVLLARLQKSGRGRHARAWISPAGNIAMSLAIPLSQTKHLTYQLNLVAALSLTKTLRNLGFASCALKWPNDVLIRDLKVAGILSEVVSDTAVVGIGVNLNSTRRDFPLELQDRLTTLRDEMGSMITEEKLIASFLQCFHHDLWEYDKNGLMALKAEIEFVLAHVGKVITIQEPGEDSVTGRFVGIAENGFLKLELFDHSVKIIMAGDVYATGI